ncbi:MAG: energy-coupled thiamine transporter ThiT [Theionarchaea archaeon]|nr:MAG: energy-coupled thiamine transporter ThiT [Theionarchaea archaeon DG-70-1]MBU7027435.1 energy-coupled thiamine transporter ThiT [Theionarchaea archaeon]
MAERKRAFTSREIAEAGIAIALAFVLSMIKVYRLPMGGSITAGSMIPILLLALRRGYKLGIVTAVLYGIVQIIEGAYIVHPAQAVLDYPLAFGALGLAGFFASRVGKTHFYAILGVIVGIIGRFVCHFLSGVIFFSEYAPEGMNPWTYSALYNGSYILGELIISVILIYLLVKKGVLELYR